MSGKGNRSQDQPSGELDASTRELHKKALKVIEKTLSGEVLSPKLDKKVGKTNYRKRRYKGSAQLPKTKVESWGRDGIIYYSLSLMPDIPCLEDKDVIFEFTDDTDAGVRVSTVSYVTDPSPSSVGIKKDSRSAFTYPHMVQTMLSEALDILDANRKAEAARKAGERASRAANLLSTIYDD